MSLNSFATRVMLVKGIVIVCVALIIGILYPKPTNGQELSARPDRGLNGNGGFQASNIDAINLENGGVSASIPLASLPTVAGGKLSYTLSAFYNSKLWDVHKTEVYQPSSEIGCHGTYSTSDIWLADNAGWRIGGGYQILFRDAREDYEYIIPESEACWGYEFYRMAGHFFKPILRTPDGAEHELFIEGSPSVYGGDRSHLKGYYVQGGTGSSPSFTSPTRMSTLDGTYYTAVFNPPSSTVLWTIYLSDGTKVEQKSDEQRIIDTNGNSILFGSNSTDGVFVKDEMTGRMIKSKSVTYNSQPATQIQYQSVTGTWQSVYVIWGQTAVTGKVFNKESWRDDDYSEVHSCWINQYVPPTTIDVVRKIIYPSTESGVDPPEYDFEYNSDTTTSSTLTAPIWNCSQGAQSDYTRTVSYGWGELSKVTTPAGSVLSYAYSHDGLHDFSPAGLTDSNEVVRDTITSKSVLHDGVTDTWTYAIDGNTGGSVTGPDGSLHSEVCYPINSAYGIGAASGFGGQVFRTVDPGGMLHEKSWVALAGTFVARGSDTNFVAANAAVDTEYTTLLATDGTTRLKMSAKKFAYDYNGNVTQVIEYDWFDPSTVTFSSGFPQGVPSGAPVLSVTSSSYYNAASSYSSSNSYRNRTVGSSTAVLGKVQESTVGTSSTVKSDTKFSYDGQSYGTAPTLGNLTKASAYSDVTSSWIDTLTTYSTHGNVTSTTDPNGNVTQITYGSVGGYSDLYPTQTIAAYGTSIARTSSATYDFYTGLSLSSTDNDNSITNTAEYDILGRPVKTISAYGTALASWTRTEYHDHDRFIVSKADLVAVEDGKKVATQFYDQLGRVRLSKTLEDAATQSATNETDGIKVETKYLTNGGYTYQLSSNPFRASTASSETDSTMGWTRSKAWNTGKKQEVETFSGATLPYPFLTSGYNSSSTGVVTTESDANTTTVTDQAGKLRRSVTNAVGQLTRVDEPNSSNALGNVTTPNQSTAYTYDVLGNLLTVGQGSQTRTFTYSSLSRLLTAANPESGTIRYGYDSNGNLQTKWDARNIKTIYDYDVLNRVVNRCYKVRPTTLGATTCSGASGETAETNTPDVTYTYDGQTHAIGKLTKVYSSVSTTEYTAFDILGRVTAHKQTTSGTDYTTAYTYNLSGALLTETYPSGRVVRNTLAANGDLSQVETKALYGSYATRASNFVYNAAGAATSLQLGNSKYENTVFNSRLQPTQIGLGTSTTDTSLLKIEYGYGTTDNNGNVKSQTITVPGVTYPFVQNYTYDSLNRLASATETYNTSTQNWKQEFSYDRYGNRNFVTGSGHTDTLAGCTTMCDPAFSSTTNRITSSGYTYDSAGNTTGDPASRTFVYDAENKQASVSNSGGTIGAYTYDGDGKRVAKVVGDHAVLFLYDAMGRLVEEYAAILTVPGGGGELGRSGPSANPAMFDDPFGIDTSYVYAGSRLLSTEKLSGPNYLTADNLGTPRINTDASGNVTARHDYMPFGEEIATAQRTTGYAPDTVRKQFTGYEKDDETGLDFAQARYNNSNLGRFSSIDPYNIIFEMEKGEDEKEKQQIFIGYISQPQIWNKYVYSINNPLNLSDPDGRRPLTQQEKDNLQNFIKSGMDFANNEITDANERQAFINGVNAAANAIQNAILAVPNDAKEDPRNLRAVLYAMGQIGDPSNSAKWSSSGSVGFNSNGANVTLTGGNKCTLFVGIAYAKGANIGWKNNGNGGGYQVNFSLRGNIYTPAANDLVSSGAANFVETSNPQLGDIAAGRGTVDAGYIYNSYHTGHAGIYISGEVIISANPDHGVRVGRFSATAPNSPNSGFKYLTYKP